jgi:hypothetical protein
MLWLVKFRFSHDAIMSDSMLSSVSGTLDSAQKLQEQGLQVDQELQVVIPLEVVMQGVLLELNSTDKQNSGSVNEDTSSLMEEDEDIALSTQPDTQYTTEANISQSNMDFVQENLDNAAFALGW